MGAAFILGVEMRSGTNYLYDLLGKHHQCHLAQDTAEDFIVSQAAYLRKFSDTMWYFWKGFSPRKITPSTLPSHLEDSIHRLLWDQAEDTTQESGVVVSKTPCALGIEELPKVFNKTKFILLVRDGRSVAYSLEKSFGISFYSALQRWQIGADKISEFMNLHPKYFQENCLLVRYEDLFASTEDELKKVFAFLGINSDEYDYEEALKSDVIGSSELKATESKIHWSGVERSSDFNPLTRFEKWPTWKLKMAEAVLEKELRKYDYVSGETRGGPLASLAKFSYLVHRRLRGLTPHELKQRFKSSFLK